MFKNFYTTTIQNQQHTLITVPSGSQFMILSIQISGGNTSGNLILRKYDNQNLAFQQTIYVDVKQPIVFQHKILLPVNYRYTVQSDVNGIQICLNVISQNLDSYNP